MTGAVFIFLAFLVGYDDRSAIFLIYKVAIQNLNIGYAQ